MLFLKAIHDVFGAETAQHCRVEFAVGNGSYINTDHRIAATKESAEKIFTRMKELQAANTPFMKKSYPIDDALELFTSHAMEDKL